MGADSEPTLIEIRKEMCRLMERNFEGRSLPPTTIDTFLARAFQAGVESGRKEVLDIIFEHDTRIHTNLGEGFTDRSDIELSLQGRKQEK